LFIKIEGTEADAIHKTTEYEIRIKEGKGFLFKIGLIQYF
jgi:hypothetical protein